MIWVSWDHPDAIAMREAMVAEVESKYAGDPAAANRDGASGVDPSTIVATGLLYEGEKAIAHAALRRLGADLEIKRMYVVPRLRGKGLSHHLLAEVEEAARGEGASRVILHTGTKQDAAIALYTRHGFTEIPLYEPYLNLPESLCFEKVLEPAT